MVHPKQSSKAWRKARQKEQQKLKNPQISFSISTILLTVWKEWDRSHVPRHAMPANVMNAGGRNNDETQADFMLRIQSTIL